LALRFATVGPDLGRLNPFTGARRLVGLRGLGRGAFALIKVVLVGSVLAVAIAPPASLSGPFGPGEGGLGTACAALWSECMRRGMLLSFLLLGLGLLEYVFQRWLYEREIRMTRAEVIEESLRLEGHPELKRRRRRLLAERAGTGRGTGRGTGIGG
jgi:flagellar biosynthetic protein FlhB